MAGFRARLATGQPLIGSFLKLPTTQGAEILGGLGFDFAVIDEEHAPLDPGMTDMMLLACQAAGLAGLVRVRQAADILRVLDCGAGGVLLPHVTSATLAQELVALCRYRNGRRGYSPTTRAGGFGSRSMAEQLDHADRSIAAIAMIEDIEAIGNIEEIVATPGLDAVFIGRGDLAVSIAGADVAAATLRVIAAARAASVAVAIMPSGADDASRMRAAGASLFITGSDQSFLRKAAQEALQAHVAARTGKT